MSRQQIIIIVISVLVIVSMAAGFLVSGFGRSAPTQNDNGAVQEFIIPTPLPEDGATGDAPGDTTGDTSSDAPANADEAAPADADSTSQ